MTVCECCRHALEKGCLAKVNGGKSQWGDMIRVTLDMADSPPRDLGISHFATFLYNVVLGGNSIA